MSLSHSHMTWHPAGPYTLHQIFSRWPAAASLHDVMWLVQSECRNNAGREFTVLLRELILVALCSCARETLMHSSWRWLLNSFAHGWFMQQCMSLKTRLLNVMHPKRTCSHRPPSPFSQGASLTFSFSLGSGAPAVHSSIFLIATEGASHSHRIGFSISLQWTFPWVNSTLGD